MGNFNKVILIGNLTRETEIKQTTSGATVGNNSLAINNTRVVDGQKVEETTFVEFSVWNKSAENLAQYQKKGSNIMIEGRLQLDTWDDKDTGKKRSKLSVVADRVQFLDPKPAEQAPVQQLGVQPQAQVYQAPQQVITPQAPQVGQVDPAGGLPF